MTTQNKAEIYPALIKIYEFKKDRDALYKTYQDILSGIAVGASGHGVILEIRELFAVRIELVIDLHNVAFYALQLLLEEDGKIDLAYEADALGVLLVG